MHNKLILLITLIGIGAIIILSHLFGFSICLFKALFHIPCPGCGLTRSFFSLMSLDFKSAFYYNALSIPLAIFFIIATIWLIIDLVRHKNTFSQAMHFKLSKKMIAIFVIITIINWIFNIYKGI